MMNHNNDPFLRWVFFCASKSRLRVDPQTNQVWVDGQLDEELRFMELNTEDLKTQSGLDLEVEIRHALRDAATEKYGFTPMEKKCAGYYLCTIPIRRV